MNTVEVFTDSLPVEIAAQLPEQSKLEAILSNAINQTLLWREIPESEISVAIVSDDRIQEINKQFLDHDYATDVITFNLGDKVGPQQLQGEIVISAETAARIGHEMETSLMTELVLYVVHGTLHLTGIDDQTPIDRAEMRRAEKTMMESLGFDYRFEPEDSLD